MAANVRGPKRSAARLGGQHYAQKPGGTKGLYCLRRKPGFLVVLPCSGRQHAIGNIFGVRNGSFVIYRELRGQQKVSV